ncbi:imidazolonepropionase-like amidohydrolase [Altererythrobacter atlanticus]|uniref:Uncharacterized protein n=1 Tax=Croceibacterium atlanticum TaxID=1267766 RepID=A0A0F7KT48_9SPHN|nr:amidohydrolase family protein [Croceibacterium atlanticum]AKH41960.1 hypothetical protein WYH_00912 [Croceibacterium atlanticum]MBB5733472.1 imidazolonepropionase-like amidohydrolase [Croceibacterium atlanticum]
MRRCTDISRLAGRLAGQLFLVALVFALHVTMPVGTKAQEAPSAEVVLRTSRIIDGNGGILLRRDILVRDGRIAAIMPHGGRYDYDLRGMTVMPGWIDTHSHIAARVDSAGNYVLPGDLGAGETPQQAALAVAINGWKTLRAGFTTIQSPGDPLDGPLRDIVAESAFPVPRILTSLGVIQAEHATTPAMAVAAIRRLKAEGADFIKLFADGHGEMSQDVLAAACAEARGLGLRSVVHSQSLAATRRTIAAGCTTIEHGNSLDPGVLRAMKDAGMFLDPNLDVTVHYARRERDLPEAASYSHGDKKLMPPGYHQSVETFRMALASGVQIAFGSDAVAGTHGENADEFVWRVIDGGQSPMEAITSATSVSASSIGLDDRIGRVESGMIADLVAVEENPLNDIRKVKHVRFVMRGGIVHRFDPLAEEGI